MGWWGRVIFGTWGMGGGEGLVESASKRKTGKVSGYKMVVGAFWDVGAMVPKASILKALS